MILELIPLIISGIMILVYFALKKYDSRGIRIIKETIKNMLMDNFDEEKDKKEVVTTVAKNLYDALGNENSPYEYDAIYEITSGLYEIVKDEFRKQ